jgi:hypothetical protein
MKAANFSSKKKELFGDKQREFHTKLFLATKYAIAFFNASIDKES